MILTTANTLVNEYYVKQNIITLTNVAKLPELPIMSIIFPLRVILYNDCCNTIIRTQLLPKHTHKLENL